MPVRVVSTCRERDQRMRNPHVLGNVFGTFSSSDMIKGSNNHAYELLLIYPGGITNYNTPTTFYS